MGTAPNIPGPRAVQGEGPVPGSWQVGGSIRKGQVRAAGLEEGGVGQGAGGQPQEGGWQVGPGLRLGGPSGAPNPGVCRVCGEDCPEAALQLLTKRTEQAFSPLMDASSVTRRSVSSLIQETAPPTHHFLTHTWSIDFT